MESKNKRAFILKKIAKIESSFVSHDSDPDLSIYYEGYNQENIYKYIDYLPYRNNIYGESYKEKNVEKYFQHPMPLVPIIATYKSSEDLFSEKKTFNYKEIIPVSNEMTYFFHILNHYKEFPYQKVEKNSYGTRSIVIDEDRHNEAIVESLILDVCFWKWLKKELDEFDKTNPTIEPKVKNKPKAEVETIIETEIAPSKKRLKWNGNKNTLADIFYQLRGIIDDKTKTPLLEATNMELQIFLKENFDIFENIRLLNKKEQRNCL